MQGYNQIKDRQIRFILLLIIISKTLKKMCSQTLYYGHCFPPVGYSSMGYTFQHPVQIQRNSIPSSIVLDQQILSQKVRILKDNLVFVSGLSGQHANIQTLSSDMYFGRYGQVQKIILTPANPKKKTSNLQIYVTYYSSIDAALAIVALDGYLFQGKLLKVSYGTTKYCAYFLKGFDCPNSACFYHHQHQPEKELSTKDSKEVFKKQTTTAIACVNRNLIPIMLKTMNNSHEQAYRSFPAIKEVIEKLAGLSIIKKSEIQDAERYILNFAQQQRQSEVHSSYWSSFGHHCEQYPNQKSSEQGSHKESIITQTISSQGVEKNTQTATLGAPQFLPFFELGSLPQIQTKARVAKSSSYPVITFLDVQHQQANIEKVSSQFNIPHTVSKSVTNVCYNGQRSQQNRTKLDLRIQELILNEYSLTNSSRLAFNKESCFLRDAQRITILVRVALGFCELP